LVSAGFVLAGTSVAAPAILGAVGYSAAGPLASSTTAAWQASLGAVQAGSLFAWLQGATMGGAAAAPIAATGLAGAATAVVGVLPGLLTNRKELGKAGKVVAGTFGKLWKR
jgi:hypothetical protein